MYQQPKGTRDFLPQEMALRNSATGKIKEIFESYGFEPLETPAFETMELLAAKGGGGEAIKKEIYCFKDLAGRELGLRFDLTVPAARVVAANPNLPKPFKRYTIDRVWRYDNPQAGRYREFLQADIDSFGANTPESEAECLSAAADCIAAVGIKKFYIRLNNRKLLSGIIRRYAKEEQAADAMRAIDKLDKIGAQKVEESLTAMGLDGKKIMGTLLAGDVKGMLESQEEKEGYAELEGLMKACENYGIRDRIRADLSLVRGLEYYTGNIFEIVAEAGQELGVQVGSVAGGGRYDRLIKLYGGQDTPAVGISLGVERLIEILKANQMEAPKTRTRVFVANAGNTKEAAIQLAQQLRKKGMPAETDTMGRKLAKQIEYAGTKGIPFVAIIGEKEGKDMITLRDMNSGTQETLTPEGLEGRLK